MNITQKLRCISPKTISSDQLKDTKPQPLTPALRAGASVISLKPPQYHNQVKPINKTNDAITACITYWHERRQIIQCPCRDGRFNPLNGAVISGLPPRPLPAYELEIEGGQVYIGEAQGPIGPL